MEKFRAAPPKCRGILATCEFPPGCGPLASRLVSSNEEIVFGGIFVSSSNSDSSKDSSRRLPMENFHAASPKCRGILATREFPPGCGPLAPSIVRSNEEAVLGGVIVSSSNFDSSKDCSRRLPLKNLHAAPPKCRGFLATYEFPPGCGPLAPRIVKSNVGVVVSSSNYDSFKDRSRRLPMKNLRTAPPKHPGILPTREFPPGCGPVAPRIVRSTREAVFGRVVDVVQETGVGVVEPPIVLGHENVDASHDISHSTEKIVPLKCSRRKKILAVRDFPPFCGRNAPLISKERNEALGFDGSKNIGKKKSVAVADRMHVGLLFHLPFLLSWCGGV